VVESEIDHPPQIESGQAQRETEAVPLDAPETDPSVASGHQPGDGAFDHGAPLSVVVEAVSCSPLRSGCAQLVVVGMDGEMQAVFGGGAAMARCAAEALGTKGCGSLSPDLSVNPG
jgi:hypothetical protein